MNSMSTKKRFISTSFSIFLSLLFSFPFIILHKTVSAAPATHLVISEIQIAGDTTNDEFIELYNPTNGSIDITNWKITKKTSSGTESTIIEIADTTIVPSQSFYLIAHENYDGSPVAEITYNDVILANNNSVTLYNNEGEIIDLVGMGTATTFETMPTGNPVAGKSIERKAFTTSTLDSMSTEGDDYLLGNSEDTNNNNDDFLLQEVPTPQNSSSEYEPQANPSTTPSPNPTGTPQVTSTPEPTETPEPTPTAGEQHTLLLSEIQIAGTTSTDEFVEIYNPNEFNVDLSGWKLTKMTATGTESTLVSEFNQTIPAYGFYLVSHTNYDGEVPADTTYTTSSSVASNNSVLLYNPALEVADLVGIGTATTVETQAMTAPSTNGSIERKAFETSTPESMTEGGIDYNKGNSYDTNNNSTDFILRENPEPQNTNSTVEFDTNTNPTITPSPSVSPSPTNTSTPTPTEEPTPTTEPSPTPTPQPEPRRSKVIGFFPLSGKVCRVEYRPLPSLWGRHFIMSRITCDHI